MFVPNDAPEKIVNEALGFVEQKYGSSPDKPTTIETMGWRPYHNLRHSMDVYQRTTKVGKSLGLSDDEMALAGIAAAAHDVIQEGERGTMEQASADWADSIMKKFRYGGDDRDVVRFAILGTEPIFKEGVIIGQKATELQFPSVSATRVAQAVACGDLGGLYLSSGPLMSHVLYREIRLLQGDDVPSLDGLIEFQASTLAMAKQYVFPHPAGEKLFGQFREHVIHYHQSLVDQLDAGSIADYNSLLGYDKQFYANLQAAAIKPTPSAST